MSTLRRIRLVFLLYGAMLTVLLLVPDPAALLGMEEVPGPPQGRAIHFAFFSVLGFLASRSRWPLRPWMLGAILVSYAAGTELLQSFVPTRSMEALDLLENLLGLSAGAGLYSLLEWRRNARPFRARDTSLSVPRCESPDSSSDNS